MALIIWKPRAIRLHNPNFKGGEFDPLLAEAGSNSFTMSPTRWVEITDAIKSNLIPEKVTAKQSSIIYAEEADVLNVAQPDCHSSDEGIRRIQQ